MKILVVIIYVGGGFVQWDWCGYGHTCGAPPVHRFVTAALWPLAIAENMIRIVNDEAVKRYGEQ